MTTTAEHAATTQVAQTNQLATFTLDDHLYGVPVANVQEVLRGLHTTPVPRAAAAIAGLMNLRGEVVPVIDLRIRLDLPESDDSTDRVSVVVRVDGEVISLLVDTIGDVIDVDEAMFENPPETLTGTARDLIRGAYKLQDRLLLALDVDRAASIAA